MAVVPPTAGRSLRFDLAECLAGGPGPKPAVGASLMGLRPRSLGAFEGDLLHFSSFFMVFIGPKPQRIENDAF